LYSTVDQVSHLTMQQLHVNRTGQQSNTPASSPS